MSICVILPEEHLRIKKECYIARELNYQNGGAAEKLKIGRNSPTAANENIFTLLQASFAHRSLLINCCIYQHNIFF
jgi:hypothetical protein